jgi:hypothetical protein
MGAVERLQAAIEKLETLAQHASVGVMFLPIQDDPVEYDLGTTLYRTIDAQLAILRDDYDVCKKENWVPHRYVLMLADAILGGD